MYHGAGPAQDIAGATEARGRVRAWIVTDGKAGDEMPCLGLAEALGAEAELRRVAPRRPWSWLMPRGPIDPREAPDRPGSPLSPPWPDVAIASGRRAVPYLRLIRRQSRGRVFTVFLKDPRTGAGTADLIWVPLHDRLRGVNVVATLTSPHRVAAARLAAARSVPPPALAALPAPRVAVLIGGPSRHHRFTGADIDRLATGLERLAAEGAALMVTASRRTPPALTARLAALVAAGGGFLWDGTGDNPYLAMLALADVIVVTADSTNMVGEAAATGAPVLVFEPTGGHARIRAFLDGLQAAGATRPFTGKLERFTYRPIDSTPILAEAVRSAMSGRAAAAGDQRPDTTSRGTP